MLVLIYLRRGRFATVNAYVVTPRLVSRAFVAFRCSLVFFANITPGDTFRFLLYAL